MDLSLEKKAAAWAILAAVLSSGGAWLIASPIQMMTGSGPVIIPMVEIKTSPALVAQGQMFFGLSCSQCHADDATGDEGPNLHRLPISNARIASTIRNGVKGEMPSFAKKYDHEQIVALISYLRSLP